VRSVAFAFGERHESQVTQINEDMKTAMKAREAARLGAIRLLLAAIKQKEVDERIELDDAAVLAVIDKMLKQRRDSIAQYGKAGRQDLVDAEQFEVGVLSGYMPQAFSSRRDPGRGGRGDRRQRRAGPQDMGKVMAVLKPTLAGRADMGQVSGLVKAALDEVNPPAKPASFL
jgi:uncharacterized protein YqeY